MVKLAITSGLRRGGEGLLGLEWHIVDWENGLLSVEQAADFQWLFEQPLVDEYISDHYQMTNYLFAFFHLSQ